MEFPTLYKKNTSGKIQQWAVAVARSSEGPEVYKIYSGYGELGGKLQTTFDLIKEGKNLGRANATTVEEQAFSEAKSKFESKLKEGYVQNLKDALDGKIDEIIAGGIEPMLAQSWDKHSEKIKFPCAVQPKLDGVRCIAIKRGLEVTLWSRSRKRITSCPHIEASIRHLNVEDVVLDGELYNHDLRDEFEKIISAVRKDKPSEESQKVQMHIYDLVEASDFDSRTFKLEDLIPSSEVLILVPTMTANDSEHLADVFKTYIDMGYEGAMARNLKGLYENKRSYNLQKVKEFEDADFEIVGVNEGKGRLQGLVGAFTCVTSSGATFEAKLKGDQEDSRKYLQNPELCIGKKLVVQFQGYTNRNEVPRFPVGLRIKDAIEG